MARDLAVFLQPLAATAEPGLESADPRLLGITALAGRSQYTPAAQQIEELLGEGIYDVRTISIYLFAAFREEGPAVLPTLIAAVDNILGESFDAVGPTAKREQHFDKRITWLFDEIVDTLEYHDHKATPEWQAWSADLTPERIDAAVSGLAAVDDKIVARSLGDGAAKQVARMRSWLYAHRGPVVAAAPPPPAEPVAAAPVQIPVVPAPVVGGRPHVELIVTPRFLELCAKLRAFEALIEKKQFRKAALVADDVQQIVEHFDPRSYFPEVFAGFSAQLSKNIMALAEHWDERDSMAWKALAQFYQVDLDGFVESG